MLSDAEQHELIAIESRLRADDPVYVERFTSGWRHRPRRGWRRLAALVAVVAAMVTAGVGLVLASVPTVVVALTAMGAASGWWLTDPGRPST
jgi:hypothetical protein